ncbi:hypothetical protein D3C87_1740490 [compost metagenome]
MLCFLFHDPAAERTDLPERLLQIVRGYVAERGQFFVVPAQFHVLFMQGIAEFTIFGHVLQCPDHQVILPLLDEISAEPEMSNVPIPGNNPVGVLNDHLRFIGPDTVADRLMPVIRMKK